MNTDLLDHYARNKTPVQLRLRHDPQIWGPGLLELAWTEEAHDDDGHVTGSTLAACAQASDAGSAQDDLCRLTVKVAIQPGVPPDHDFTLYFEAADVLWISEGPKDADGKSPVTTFGAPARGQRSGLVIG